MVTGTCEALLVEATKLGLLDSDGKYGRSALLQILMDAGATADQAAAAFKEIRAASQCGVRLGSYSVHATGTGRGRCYALREAQGSDELAPVSEPSPVASAHRARTVHPAELSAGYTDRAKLDIYLADNLSVLREMPSNSFDLIYIDPPFNTGKVQSRTALRTVRDDERGDRTGFQGHRYRTIRLGTLDFQDAFDDFLNFLEPRLFEARRLLKPSGSFFLHIDYREVHYCKVVLDHVFGRESFMNEIVWAYDYGARSKRKWSAKHDNILWYANDPQNYTFNFEEMDRIPYMAPGLVGKEKAARGKTPTDVWWHTIVPTNGKERTGYPTQKPVGILSRLLKVHSRPGDRVLDFFAGSGTTGEAALNLGRSCTLIDVKVEAVEVMAKRLARMAPVFHGWEDQCADRRDAPAGRVLQHTAQRSLFE